MTTPTPAPRFEERLLHQLQHVVAQSPAPRTAAAAPAPAPARPLVARIPRRRLALSGGLTTAVAATVAVVLATSGGVASPAYAVESSANGSVTVSISDLRDAAGLQAKLRAAGIPAIVDYVADPQRCAGGAAGPGGSASGPEGAIVRSHKAGDDGPTTATAGSGPGLSTHTSGGPPPGGGAVGMSTRVAADGSASFTVNPSDLRPGETLMIAATTGRFSSLGMAVVKDPKHAPELPCIPGDAK